MRWTSHLRTAGLAGALVAAAAAAPFVASTDAEARPDRGGDYTSRSDNARALHDRRGPFFGLRMNSFDVNSDKLRVVACFRYRCAPIRDDAPGVGSRYTVLREHHFDEDVNVTDCDEVLRRAFAGREVRFAALVSSTRWIRDVGPNGKTPIGGFLADMTLYATFAAGDTGRVTFPMLDFWMVGTQGMRPRRGDPATDADPGETTRCDAPFHDEGWYTGRVNRKGVKKLIRMFGDDNVLVNRLRRLHASVIAGTFEGGTRLRDDSAPYDFCNLAAVAWWFDGLVGYRCRPQRSDVERDEPPEPDEPVRPDDEVVERDLARRK